ncbi:MAG: hypothetical protein QOE33_874 [Acidobacteriota bacterium]|nr:hypothetical protein [Acidobacteriota bacterium]
MIGFFPSVYPGELFYSLCARYSERVHYPSTFAVNAELFGSNHGWGTVGIPVRLNHFVSTLPAGQPYSVDDFIANNTLLPYYTPFFPVERICRMLKVMKGSADAVKQSLSGTFNSSVKPPARLRFCPLCLKRDTRKYGELYWHRLHQAPGVEVCPAHLILLEYSDIPSHNQGNSQRFVSAAHLSFFITPKRLDTTNRTHQTLLRIAQDIQWLLGQRDLSSNFGSLHICYKNILAERGLIHTGSLKLRTLCDGFQMFYPSQLLSLLQCQFDKRGNSNWLSRLLPYLNRGIASHPLRHLLLIQFLGYTAESFFRRCQMAEPFKPLPSKKPLNEVLWVCLNPACDFFRRQPLNDCAVTYDNQGGRYYGTFQCVCGFTHTRRVPITHEDRFRVGIVKAYGPIWETALRELWNNPYFTLKDIASELGVYHWTVKYQALRLDLTFPRPGPGRPSTQLSLRHVARLKKVRRTEPDKLKNYRSRWLANLKLNKGASRSTLRRKLIHVHYWLSKHDREWLESHMPPPRWSSGPSRVRDWNSRDSQLATEIHHTALQLMNTEGRPVRITKSAIFRDRKLYKYLLNRKTAAKLPLTQKALSEVVETRVQFSRRRIKWAVACFTREGVVPSFTRLAERAGVTNSAYVPEVTTVLESAVLSLRCIGNASVVKVA